MHEEPAPTASELEPSYRYIAATRDGNTLTVKPLNPRDLDVDMQCDLEQKGDGYHGLDAIKREIIVAVGNSTANLLIVDLSGRRYTGHVFWKLVSEPGFYNHYKNISGPVRVACRVAPEDIEALTRARAAQWLEASA